MPPGNTASPSPAQREAAGRLLREARRRRELTLRQVAQHAHYANHQTAHHWETTGPPWRDRTRLLWILRAYRLHRSEADYLLAQCGHPHPLSDPEWQEYGDPHPAVQPLPLASGSQEEALEGLLPPTPGEPQITGLDPSPSPDRQASPLAERRQVTVLRTFLSGVPLLADRLSYQDLQEALDRLRQAGAAAVAQLGGRALELTPDGLVAGFGLPVAHEDDARRAVEAGLSLLASLASLNQQLADQHGLGLGVSVVAHTTTGVLAEGDPADAPARLVLEQPLDPALGNWAMPGALVISQATHRLVEGFFTCQRLDNPDPSGQSETLNPGVYRVLGESGVTGPVAASARSGRLSPLVGRAAEVETLLGCWAQTQQGAGQTVLLRGEPGIGKSRLVLDLKEKLAAGPALVLEGQCLELYQQSPLHPIILMLETLLGLGREQPPEEKLAGLAQALAAYGPGIPETLPLLASLLSLPLSPDHPLPLLTPSVLRQRTLEAAVDLLLRLAREQPALFLLEDLHWADASTPELLGLLVEHTATAPVMALLTFRPELEPPAWVFRDQVVTMRLAPLSRAEEELLIGHLLGGASLPEAAHRELLARTEGVPLYIEELVRLVLDSRQLGPSGAGDPGSGLAQQLPGALQGGLTARLDRLPGGRTVAQLGAAIGASFSYRLLQAASTLGEEATRQALGALVGSGLLYQRGLGPEASYSFKHALIRDQVYRSLTRRSREECHRWIAEGLSREFPEVVVGQPEIVAHHYTEAGLGREAIPHWRGAGEQALQRWAIAEAISHLSRGLELVAGLPEGGEKREQELRLLMSLAPSLMATRGFGAPETVAAYQRVLELCRLEPESPHLFPAAWGLYIYHYLQGKLTIAQELSDQMLRLSERSGQTDHRIVAYFAKGDHLFTCGDSSAGQQYLEMSADLIDEWQFSWTPVYGSDMRILILHRLAINLWFSGYPDRAMSVSDQAIAIAEESNYPMSIAVAHLNKGYLLMTRQQSIEALKCAELGVTIAKQNELAVWTACGMLLHGWALAYTGEGQRGIQDMHAGMEILESTGTPMVSVEMLIHLGEVYGVIGDLPPGISALDEVLDRMQKLGVPNCYLETQAWRVKGELLLQGNSELEAERCLQRAIAIARDQGFKLPELKATINLCRLLQQRGETRQARELLAEVYDWFTEGFDTPDLIEAKELLDQLI